MIVNETVKDVVIRKYGSVNNFLAIKAKEFNGELPIAREHIYKLINHEVPNPGIKSLNILADMIGIPREQVYKEYSE